MRVLLHSCTTSSLALGLIGFSFVLSLPYRGFVGDLGVITHNGHVSTQVERYLLRRVCVLLVGYSAHRLQDSGVVALRLFCFVGLTCVSFLVALAVRCCAPCNKVVRIHTNKKAMRGDGNTGPPK